MKYFIIDEFGVKHRYPYEPQGDIVVAAEALEYTYTAGATVVMERVVMLSGGKVIHFDPTDENNLGKVAGIAKNAAAINQVVTVVQEVIIPNSGMGMNTN
jgi:hypothetical protein